MQLAYYNSAIDDFLVTPSDTVLGALARAHTHDLNDLQRNAWIAQFKLLRSQLNAFRDGWMALEFVIPRMGKRADTILIIAGVIFVIEFKMGADRFSRAARDQATDYALGLKNFHAGSHERRIVPILVATDATSELVEVTWNADGVATVLTANAASLEATITAALAHIPA